MNNQFEKDVEKHMLDHMNADHVDAMRDYCAFANIDVGDTDPQMVSLDQDGFYLHVNGANVRFNFKQKCISPEDVRKALVQLAETAREQTKTESK